MIVTVLGTSCSGGVDPAPEPQPEASVQPLVVPDLDHAALDSAHRILGPAAERTVVRFPLVEASYTVEATRVAGKYVAAHVVRFGAPERILRLVDVDAAAGGVEGHLVIGQFPAPGTPLSGDTTITLTVGPHPYETDVPWLVGHPKYLGRTDSVGIQGCYMCHPPRRCADCHANWNDVAFDRPARRSTRSENPPKKK
jgi:hypothetical protein